jgi:hypothetical protein
MRTASKKALAAATPALAGSALMASSTIMATPAKSAVEDSDTFISTSGLPHFDIADVRNRPGWDPGEGNSTSPSWEASIDNVFAAMAGETDVDATIMTGDLVSGFWGRDVDNSGIFGPVKTTDQKKKAVVRAANTYYGELKRDWAAHPGLGPVFPAAGDHELGGMPHNGKIDAGTHAYKMYPTAKQAWVDNFGHPLTYAVELPGEQNVKLATLNPTERTSSGTYARIKRRDLDWLASEFANYDGWKIIQVEIPPSPVAGSSNSSRTVLRNGGALWQKARQLGVHVIFSAEVHELNALQQPSHTGEDGPVLITNGGAMYGGGAGHYVLTTVSSETLTLTGVGKTVSCSKSGTKLLWQTTDRRPLAQLSCETAAKQVGKLAMTDEGEVIQDSGALELRS